MFRPHFNQSGREGPVFDSWDTHIKQQQCRIKLTLAPHVIACGNYRWRISFMLATNFLQYPERESACEVKRLRLTCARTNLSVCTRKEPLASPDGLLSVADQMTSSGTLGDQLSAQGTHKSKPSHTATRFAPHLLRDRRSLLDILEA